MISFVKYIRSTIEPYITNLKIMANSLYLKSIDNGSIDKDLNAINTNLNNHIKDKNNPHKNTIDQVSHVGTSSPTDSTKHTWFNFM